MSWQKWHPNVAVLVASMVLMAPSALAATSGGDGRALIVNVSRDGKQYLHGNNGIAINPRNPNNLVYVSTQHPPPDNGPVPPSVIPDPPTNLPKFYCYVAYSMNRGKTWTSVPWPNNGRPYCGIPQVAVSPDGTFYVSGNELGGTLPLPDPVSAQKAIWDGTMNHAGVAASTDGGKTWSTPTTPQITAEAHPKIRVDAATGVVYLESGCLKGGVYGNFNDGDNCLVVSHDHAKTWSAGGLKFPGTHLAVHAGRLAYAAFSNGNVTFSVSKDEGKTFTTSNVQDGQGHDATAAAVDSGTCDTSPWISADPTTPGRFAVMQYRTDKYEVYVTNDTGKHWSGPSLIAAPHAWLGWMEYGRTGVLGVLWRVYGIPDGGPSSAGNDNKSVSLDVYSTASFTHGIRFSPALKLTPKTAESGHYWGCGRGEDYSTVNTDGEYLYGGWPGSPDHGTMADGMFARVPLAAYRRR